MPTTETLSTPRAIDTKLAELHYQMQRIAGDIAMYDSALKSMAGAEYYYRGRRRVTNMTTPEARELLEAELAKGEPRLSTNFSYDSRQARKYLAELDAAVAELAAVQEQSRELGKLYTGWSRFFLVTSSAGHIHSSMACSTCRPTTVYGWLAQHSGKSETEVVEELGPALCSVCFPSAPTEWQGQTLSKKQAADILAGKTPTADPAKVYCAGSGQPSATQVNWRRMTPYGTCPRCGHVGAVTQNGSMRKHQAKAK